MMDTNQVPVGTSTESLWRSRDFLALWVGQIVSTLGTANSATALPLLVLAVTGSPADAGMIGAVTALPALAVQLPAGALVDRWNRRTVMLVCELLAGLALLAVPTTLWLGRPGLFLLAIAVVVQRGSAVFFGSAQHAALPAIVPDSLLSDAIAQNEAKSRAAGLLGPPLGGLLFGVGRAVPFLVDGATSLAAAAGLLVVRSNLRPVRDSAPQSVWRESAHGLTWIWHHSLIRIAILLIALSNLVFEALALTLVVLAREHGTSSARIGLMFGIYGAGGVLGALVAPKLRPLLSPKTVIVAANWLWAGLLPLFLLTTNPLLLGTLGAASAFVGPLWNVVITTYLIMLVPDELRGRVTSAAMAMATSVLPLASALAGYSLAAFGPSWTLCAIALVMLATAVAGSLSPAIRRAPSGT